MTGGTGAGLFDMRSLSTPTLVTMYNTITGGPKAETALFAMLRRILIERNVL
jgi:hypothetical protein